jgi:hypothetical protein
MGRHRRWLLRRRACRDAVPRILRRQQPRVLAVKPEAARHLSDVAAAVGRVHRVHAIGAKLMRLSSVAIVIDDANQQFDAVTLHGLQRSCTVFPLLE